MRRSGRIYFQVDGSSVPFVIPIGGFPLHGAKDVLALVRRWFLRGPGLAGKVESHLAGWLPVVQCHNTGFEIPGTSGGARFGHGVADGSDDRSTYGEIEAEKEDVANGADTESGGRRQKARQNMNL